MSLRLEELLIHGIVLLVAFPLHEYAHGYMAYKLGDPTAKNLGRLTLNPLAHLDPFGTLSMIVLGIGWAKPVPVNPMYFKDPKKGMALTALAGPMTNIILAFLSMVVLKVFVVLGIVTYGFSVSFLGLLLQYMVLLNIALAVFNMIPIPPLDGSKVLSVVLPERTYFQIQEYEQYIMIGFIAFMYLTDFVGIFINSVGKQIFQLFDTLTKFIH